MPAARQGSATIPVINSPSDSSSIRSSRLGTRDSGPSTLHERALSSFDSAGLERPQLFRSRPGRRPLALAALDCGAERDRDLDSSSDWTRRWHLGCSGLGGFGWGCLGRLQGSWGRMHSWLLHASPVPVLSRTLACQSSRLFTWRGSDTASERKGEKFDDTAPAPAPATCDSACVEQQQPP